LRARLLGVALTVFALGHLSAQALSEAARQAIWVEAQK
jgi:hypothetical protein